MAVRSDEYTTPYRDEKGKFAKRPGTEELTQVQTGEQQPGHYAHMPYIFGSFMYANGGTALNPMGFPGYGTLYGGTYINYRWMLQHPVLRLVRSIATADILCNKWEYVGDDPEDVKLVRDMLDPIRMDLLQDFYMRGRDMGWYGGEIIWENRGTYTWLTRVKPLLVDVTECLRDERGYFSGLVNRVPDSETNPKKPEVRIAAPFKAFKYTYDSEAGYLYGRSWLENVRMTAWRDWLDCAQQLQRLGAKITGVQLILKSPAGTFPGPIDPTTGKPKQISYRETCEMIIKALANGAPGAWLPSLNLPVDVKGNLNTAKIIAELAQKSVISHELLDHGSTTPAIVGLLERMRHAEELMFDGGMRPPAMGHGESGKANMEQKSEVGEKVSQLEDQDFARQCQSLADSILVLNRGGNKRGAVRIVPPSIVDNKRAYMKAILLAAMNDPTIAREMLRIIDVNTELANIDIRTKDTYSPQRIEKADDKAQKAKAVPASGAGGSQNTNKKPDPQGGRPKKGEGNAKARPQKGRKAA
jgi:hypothetical protein